MLDGISVNLSHIVSTKYDDAVKIKQYFGLGMDLCLMFNVKKLLPDLLFAFLLKITFDDDSYLGSRAVLKLFVIVSEFCPTL